jgi:hypothetical protein
MSVDKESSPTYYVKNKAQIKKQRADYRAKNKDSIKEKGRVWREKNRETIRVKNREWRAKNPAFVKEQDIKGLYGIDLNYMRNMYVTQGGVCAICRLPFRTRKEMHIDHDHSTGVVRGILCKHCNTGLGLFKDKIDNLIVAIEYLKRSSPMV